MQTKIAEQKALEKEEKEKLKLSKDIPLVKHEYKKTKKEELDLNKKVLSLKDIIEKYKKGVKEGKVNKETYKQKVFETQKKIEKIEAKKAKVHKKVAELQAKKEEIKAKLHKITSDLQKRVEKNPEQVEKDIRSKTIEICKKKINEKERKLEKIEKLSEKASKLKEMIKRETSPVVRKKLEIKVAKVKTQIHKGERAVKKLTVAIKKDKKVIRQAGKILKKIKHAHEKEKLKDLVKGKCTAYSIRPHRRYCIKRNKDKTCKKWSSIYRTEKCMVWKGDECVQKNYKYSRKTSRYQCVSRNHQYKIEKCVKFDTKQKCLSKKTFYGIKKCLKYDTDGNKLVCVKSKVLFPQYACKTKVGDVCTEVVYHRARFYCQIYKLNKQGHRYCHKVDVFYGENNYHFQCLKEGTFNGKKAGCLLYKKVHIPGTEKLQKIGKTWLKSHCKALKKNSIKKIADAPLKKMKKKKETMGCKRSVYTKKEKLKDIEAKKIIEKCKTEIKEKLRAMRKSNRIIKRQSEIIKREQRSTGSKTIIDKNAKGEAKSIDGKKVHKHSSTVEGKEVEGKSSLSKKHDEKARKVHHQKLTQEQIRKIKRFELIQLGKIKGEKTVLKKADKIIKMQKKAVKSTDKKVFSKALDEIKKQASIKRKCNLKITKLSEEGFKKWSVGRVQVEAKKQLKCKYNLIQKEKETIFGAKKEIAANEALIKSHMSKKGKITVIKFVKGKKVKVVVDIGECKRKIKLAKTLIQEAKKTIVQAKKSVKVLQKDVKDRLGKKLSGRIVKSLTVKYSKGRKYISKCNTKIISLKAKVQLEQAKLNLQKGIKKFKLFTKIFENKSKINMITMKKWKKQASRGIIYYEAKKVARSEKRAIRLVSKKYKKFLQSHKKVGPTLRKRIRAEIRRSRRIFFKATTTIVKKAPYRRAIRKADRLIRKRKVIVRNLRKRIEQWKKMKKTRKILHKIRVSRGKIIRTVRFMKKLRKVRKQRIYRRRRYLRRRRRLLRKIRMRISRRRAKRLRIRSARYAKRVYRKRSNTYIVVKKAYRRRVKKCKKRIQSKYKILTKVKTERKKIRIAAKKTKKAIKKEKKVIRILKRKLKKVSKAKKAILIKKIKKAKKLLRKARKQYKRKIIKIRRESRRIIYLRRYRRKQMRRIWKYSKAIVVKRQVKIINRRLRYRCHKDIRLIRKYRAKIIRYQRILRRRLSKSRRRYYIRRITYLRRLINKRKRLFAHRKKEILKNKMIVIRKYRRVIVKSRRGHVISRKALITLTWRRIKSYMRRIRIFKRRRSHYQRRVRTCRNARCRNMYNLKIERTTKIIRKYVNLIKRARRYRANLLKILKRLRKIRLVQTYYKKRVTCSKRENWKSFRVIRRQRIKLIKRATRNIVRARRSKYRSARFQLRRWRRVVRVQLRAIRRDKKRTIKVIKNCMKLYKRKRTRVFKAIVRKSVKKTCSGNRIKVRAKSIMEYRKKIIKIVTEKIKKDKKALALASANRRRVILAMIKRYKRIIQRQMRNIENDRSRILAIVNQCTIIKQNSLEIKKKKVGITCNPVKLRNRIHSIITTVFMTMRRARNQIKLNQLRMKNEKNLDIRRALVRQIRRLRRLLKNKRRFVLKNKKNLKKTIKTCKKYGFYVKTIIYLRHYITRHNHTEVINNSFGVSFTNGVHVVHRKRKYLNVKVSYGRIHRPRRRRHIDVTVTYHGHHNLKKARRIKRIKKRELSD